MALTAPSSTLTGQTIAASYDQVLFLDAAAGVTEATLKIVSGTAGKTALSISDEHVLIKGVDTNNAAGFEVQQTDGTSILKVAAGTPSVLVSGSGTKLYLSDAGGEYISGDGTDLTITSGNDIVFATAAGGSVYYAGAAGTFNTVFGLDAGDQLASGDNYNTFIGHNVATANMTNATGNTGVGYTSLTALTEGDSNTVIGAESGAALNTGSNNTIVGMQAGDAMTDGTDNTIIGKSALTIANSGESYNTVIGMNAGFSIDHADSDNNVIMGYNAGIGGGAAMASCTVIGVDAMNSTAANAQTGTVAIGYNALTLLTSGSGNTAIGFETLAAVAGNSEHTAVGHQALKVCDGNDSNTAVGFRAGYDLTSGDDNVFIGSEAAQNVVGGSDNVIIGKAAGGTTTAGLNMVLIGRSAGRSGLITAAATGTVAIGHSALDALTSGAGNTAVGYKALTTNEDGNKNTAIGYEALMTAEPSVSGRGENTAVGYQAGKLLSTAQSNTFIGFACGDEITTGEKNTAVGSGALHNADGSESDNTCVGYVAGDVIDGGSTNTIIGSVSDPSSATASNQTVVGYATTGQADNSVTLGNTSVTDVYMSQDSGAAIHCANILMGTGSNFYLDGGSNTYITEESADNIGLYVGGSLKAFLSASQFNVTGNGVFSGSISKGSGSFKIDHPLPSKKDTHYLVHSFTESPRADLIYRDKVTLVDGSATVNIDTVAGMTEGTFVLLCDSVQCFTSNESDWKAVKGSVSGNILTIECEDSSSTADISWMVVGDRKDQHIMDTDWTDENGKPIIEPEKENA